MNFGRFCESGFWMAKVAMNRMSEGNTFYGRKLHITSYGASDQFFSELEQQRHSQAFAARASPW